MIDLCEVTLEIGGRAILRNVSLSPPPGRLSVVVGPNGAGKSSLIRLLSGEQQPTIGLVRLSGIPLPKLPPYVLARRRSVVPQASALRFPFLVHEVVELGISVPNFSTLAHSGVTADAMRLADVLHLRDRYYTSLSGGECQRVHFARAICQLLATSTPPAETALLLDEPTSNLDLPHQMKLMACAAAEAGKGRTVVAVLHDLNLAATWADHVIALRNGEVVAQGGVHSVLTTRGLTRLYGFPIEVTYSDSGAPLILPQRLDKSAIDGVAGELDASSDAFDRSS